jgi:hypothetical protein
VRQDQAQAFGRLATDREHAVVAYTHDATFSACLEPIHLINQHDHLSYFHFCGNPFGFACELFCNDRNDIYLLICPCIIQETDILFPAKNIASRNWQSGY